MENIVELISNAVSKIKNNPEAVRKVIKMMIIYIVIYLVFLAGISYFEITQEGIQNYFAKFGVFAVVIFFFAVVIISMTPLPDSPIVAAGIIIMGVPLGFVMIWLSLVVSGMINFTIAKRLGRNFVQNYFPESIKYADRFAQENGIEAVIIARIFTFVTFDMISYAAGITSMPYFKYFIALVIGILPIAINYTFLGAAIASGNLLTSILSFSVSVAFAIALGLLARAGRKKYFKDL